MIIEDQNMSDCLATYGERSRRDHEGSRLSSRCGLPQTVGSNHHHSFLKRLKIDISETSKIFKPWIRLRARLRPDG
jgi:hypothetical protein